MKCSALAGTFSKKIYYSYARFQQKIVIIVERHSKFDFYLLHICCIDFKVSKILKSQKQSHKCICKISLLKNFVKFTRQQLFWSLQFVIFKPWKYRRIESERKRLVFLHKSDQSKRRLIKCLFYCNRQIALLLISPTYQLTKRRKRRVS